MFVLGGAVFVAFFAPTEVAASSWLVKNQATDVKVVPSPFVHQGEAVWFKAPADDYAGLVWQSTDVVPGKRYSISFFFQSARIENPAHRLRLALNIYDDQTQIHTQNLYRRNYAQFYTTEVEFQSTIATVRLDVPAGDEIVVGHFGEAVNVKNLAETIDPLSMQIWLPTFRLPRVYRGLRDFQFEMKLSNKFYSDQFGLAGINIVADMKVAAAKLPRLLPGKNSLNIVQTTADSDGEIEIAIEPRQLSGEPEIHIDNDPVVPADGATFGRVFILTQTESRAAIPGAFYRLKGPPEISIRPYVRAISDSQKLQITREFHLTSLTPGDYELSVERWTGRDWVDTRKQVSVAFEKVAQSAPNYRQSDYANRWIQPESIRPDENSPAFLGLSLDGVGTPHEVSIPIASELAPKIDWKIKGPVRGLALYSDFQPDPRTLRTTAESLHRLVTAGKENAELEFALGTEAYVALFMEGMLQEGLSTHLNYPSLGRIHREGRGWCMQYSSAVYAMAVEGGLEARHRNLPNHVNVEVRGEHLPISNLDAMVQAVVTDASGNRAPLNDLADNPNSRVLGAGVDEFSQRGSFAGYYTTPVRSVKPWMTRDQNNTAYRNQFLDHEVLSFDLAADETLTWSSGSVAAGDFKAIQGLRAENQNIITQTTHRTISSMQKNSAVTWIDLEPKENGLLAPKGNYKVGHVKFSLNYAVEVSDLVIDLDGSIDPGGEMEIKFYPDLKNPLIAGHGWVLSED
ncbi:MAG: hypothetical protein SynsKO_35180 [Synoicihabitans sp.]